MMRSELKNKKWSVWMPVILCFALAVFGYLFFMNAAPKRKALIFAVAAVIVLLRGDRRRLWNLPTLLLMGYSLFTWLTIFWAMSGKFHLRTYSKIFAAVVFLLFIVLRERFDRRFARAVMGQIAGLSAIYAFASVLGVSYQAVWRFVQSLPGLEGLALEFSYRLNGIFGNANMEASVFALGVLCSVALLCGAEAKREKLLYSVTLSFSAFCLVLGISLGAIACFAAAVVIYLIFAGKGRVAALLRMLECALPTLVCSFAAYALFSGGRSGLVPVVMLANAAVTAGLELTLTPRLSAVLAEKQKLTIGVLIALVACVGIYAAAAMTLTGAHTFGASILRAEELSAGEHTLVCEADGDVSVRIFSRNSIEVLEGSDTDLYEGSAGTVTFTVPEGTVMCYFSFSGETGAVLKSAVIDGAQELPMHYKLLPEFAASRLQGLSANSSPIYRRMYREDSIKLWRLSPIVGNGAGSFESGISRVQNYYYETKFAHNHYLQVLVEDGVIGFALFVGALVTMLAALWKKRKMSEENEFYWLYPALVAAFVMNGLQMLWDASMSMVVFLCMTYAVYGLIIRICAEPLGAAQAVEETGKKRAARGKKTDGAGLVRYGGIVFSAIFGVTVIGSIIGGLLMYAPVSSASEFMNNLSAAAAIDLYEKNDAKLSFVMNSTAEDFEGYREQADKYAEQLSKAQSNSIPLSLLTYYLNTQQYGKAIDEAILGATYSASSPDTWTGCIYPLKEALIDSNMFSPLLSDRETLMPKLMEYYELLCAYNARALEPVELDGNCQLFFERVQELYACMDDDEAFAVTLLVTE